LILELVHLISFGSSVISNLILLI